MRRAAAWLLVLAALPAFAQPVSEPPSELELFRLEQTVKTKVASATGVEQEIATVPSVISVLGEEQIRTLGLRTLRDALMLMAGVTVLDTGFGDHSIAVRGLSNPANLLFTLDGTPLNDFYRGAVILDLPLENIDRIEIIRGPGSALYGSNAFAGVVSLFTKRGEAIEAGAGGEALFDHSTGWGARLFGRATRSVRDWSFRLYGSYWETSGPKVLVEKDNSVGAPWSKVPGETESFRRVGQVHLAVEKRGVFTSRDSLELWGAFLIRKNGPFFGPNNVLAPDSSVEANAAIGTLEHRLPLSYGVATRLRFEIDRRGSSTMLQDQPDGFYSEMTGNFAVEPGELFPEGKLRNYDFTSYRVALKPQVTWDLWRPRRVASNNLTVGAELAYEWLPQFRYSQNYENGFYKGALQNYDKLPLTQRGKDRLLVAVLVQDQLQPIRRLWITAGMRFDWYSDFGFAWNPRAAVVWQAHPKISLKVLYGRAFRAPTFEELYDHTGSRFTPAGRPIAGNHQLRPETTNTVEAGVEVGPLEIFSLRANGFYIRTNDTIEVDPTFSVAGTRFINFPGREIGGLEAEAQLSWNPQNSILANFSYFHSRQLGEGLPGFETMSDRRFIQTRMTDLPELRFNLQLYSMPFSRFGVPAIARLRFGLSYSFASDSRNNGRSAFEAFNVYRRSAWHEINGSVTLPLWIDRLDLIVSLSAWIDRKIPITLMTGFYELPAGHSLLFVGLRGNL